ncbi:MAG: flagellar export chaperone FliS [Gemmatimonadetes bacterium]|jgi:flagellar secretion chaperone FliS|nr:flagellar export chaperone FliS [Gemmatimonadota bacterium]
MNRGGYKQYSQVQIQTANKGKLIVMLYQGAIRFMKKAQLLIDKNDMEGKGNCLIRAQDIILELLYALDQEMLEKGDDLALNLQRLYLYAYRRLVQANIHIDVQAIDEVIALMANLLEAWERIIGGTAQGEVGGQANSGVALTG